MRYKELIRRPKIATVQDLQGLIFKLALIPAIMILVLLALKL